MWQKEYPEMPLGSLSLSGPVVGAPSADNLKIRPEFFPRAEEIVWIVTRYCPKTNYNQRQRELFTGSLNITHFLSLASIGLHRCLFTDVY